VTPIRSLFFPQDDVIHCILKESMFAALLPISFSSFTNVNTFDCTEVLVARVRRVFVMLSGILMACGTVIQQTAIKDKYVELLKGNTSQ